MLMHFRSTIFQIGKKKDRLKTHVGEFDSVHNQALRSCQALMNRKQHIEVVINRQSNLVKREYRIHLMATIDYIQFLLRQGLAFPSHDELVYSPNQGNFLELRHFMSNHNEEIDKVLKNACGNLKLVAPNIQKGIVTVVACETTKIIVNDVRDIFLLF